MLIDREAPLAFLATAFEPADWVAVFLKSYASGRVAQRVRPVPVGSRLRVTRYRHFNAACSLGKCPRARTARRYRTFNDSIAFVEQIPFLLSRS